MFKQVDLAKFLSSLEANDDVETVYLLGLEGTGADPSWSLSRKALDFMIRAFQPAPVFTHVELLLLPRTRGDETHFSTYLGHTAGWGSSFPGSRNFYLGSLNVNHWRAIPVQGTKIAEMLRRVCCASSKAPYSLSRYAFSVPPLRALASFLPDDPSSPAHCAGLTARLLSEACRDVALPHSPPWYSPSTIYIELARPSRMLSITQRAAELRHQTALVEDEEIAGAVETLLRGSDLAVQTMSSQLSEKGIVHLTEIVAAQRIGSVCDAVRERILEKQLARALLRYVELS